MSPLDNLFSYTASLPQIILLPLCLYDLLSWQSTLLDTDTKEKDPQCTCTRRGEKLLRLVCRAKLLTPCQRLNPSVIALAPIMRACDVNRQLCAVNRRNMREAG